MNGDSEKPAYRNIQSSNANLLLVIGLIAVLGLAVVVIPSLYGTPRYWKDYRGDSEAEILEVFGEPIFDSRVSNPDLMPPGEYRFGYEYGFSKILWLDFDPQGLVAEQKNAPNHW